LWEYYFEPVIPEYPVCRIPAHVIESISENPPDRNTLGRFVGEFAFVTNHPVLHILIEPEKSQERQQIGNRSHQEILDIASRPPRRVDRELTSSIIQTYVRPREYIVEEVERFSLRFFSNRFVIGVQIRGTDALVDPERPLMQTGINYRKYFSVLRQLLREKPDALVFVAADTQSAIDIMRREFGNRMISYDSIRHDGGQAVGMGPAGGRMPAFLTLDPDQSARCGEEAIIEYLLLCKSDYLVHNLSGIARTVLLTVPDLSDVQIKPSVLDLSRTLLRRSLIVWRRRAGVLLDTIRGKPARNWLPLLWQLLNSKVASRRGRAL
jgi:hypothetical protein